MIGATLVLLTGCGSGDESSASGGSDGAASIAPTEAAAEVTRSLRDATGSEPDSVSCPSGISTDTGATSRCELTDGAQTFGVTVTVVGRSDGEVTLDVVVDAEPQG